MSKLVQIAIINEDRPTKIPTKTKGNIGYDIYADVQPTDGISILPPGKTVKFGTNLAAIIHEDFAMILKTRSSSVKKELIVNGGVIDASYRGEWCVCLSNLSAHFKFFVLPEHLEQIGLTMEEFTDGTYVFNYMNGEFENYTREQIEEGMMTGIQVIEEADVIDLSKAVCQGIITEDFHDEIEQVDLNVINEDITERGRGGFGSSGK